MTDTEIESMEKRLHDSLTRSLTESLTTSLTASLQGAKDNDLQNAIASMNNAVTQMMQCSSAMNLHVSNLDRVQTEVIKIQETHEEMRVKQDSMKSKVTYLEKKSLESSLVIRGIPEEKFEKESTTLNKIYGELLNVIVADNESERELAVRRIGIKRCKRIGRYSEERSRPVSVEFLLKSDADYVLENRNSLNKDIYVDREYDEVTEKKWSILRPFLKAAKSLPDYRKKCKLEGSQLKIQSRKFTVNTLHKLPKELKLFEKSSKQDSHSIAFFGIINPLSNFHPAVFVLDGVRFHSSEQFIQYQKAKLFKDTYSMAKIMSTISALECKQQGNTIKGFVNKTWKESAKKLCRPGIEAKFHQNRHLMESLIFETGNKVIVEGAKDEVWGSGQPLESPHCLDQAKWTSQGIMGEILSDIRDKQWSVMRPAVMPMNVPQSNPHPTFQACPTPNPHRHIPYGHSIPVHQSMTLPNQPQPPPQPPVYNPIPASHYGILSNRGIDSSSPQYRHPEATDTTPVGSMDTEINETQLAFDSNGKITIN